MRPIHECSFIPLFAGSCTVLVCLFGLLTPSSAFAATDDKTYPATSCRKMQGSTGTLGTRSDGSVENDHAFDPLTVICPIVRDNTQTTGSWSIDVRVLDQTASGVVTCTASSVGTFGVLVPPSATASTSPMGMGGQSISMAPPSQSVDGYSVLKCTIPASGMGGPRSNVRAYTVREIDQGASSTDQKGYTGTYAELATPAAGAFPWIKYPDLGKAAPINAAANDEWIFPIVRDHATKFWNRARFRFNDSDADLLVGCWMANFNEDGTVAGFLSFGAQIGSNGPATNTVNIDPNAGLNNGPLAMYCTGIASDVTATMYDVREIN